MENKIEQPKKTFAELEIEFIELKEKIEKEIVKKILIKIIFKKNINPFNYELLEKEFNSNNLIKKYNIVIENFFNYVNCFKTYTYSMIYNKIINDQKMKNENGQPISINNSNYFKIFKSLLNKYKYVKFVDVIEFDFPDYRRNIWANDYLRDNLGNYILPRLNKEFNMDSRYNLSNLFLKN